MSKGKDVPAQKKTYNALVNKSKTIELSEGKTHAELFIEFVDKMPEINLSEMGSNSKKEPIELDDKDERMIANLETQGIQNARETYIKTIKY